jgi:hypothetical protein
LTTAFAQLEIIAADEGDGNAWMLARKDSASCTRQQAVRQR